MEKKSLLYFLLCSNLFGNLIIHDKIESSSYGLPIPIKAFLDVQESDVHRFSLLYRSYGNIEYIETPMIQIGKSVYRTEIPGEFTMRDYVEYYLRLEMPHHSHILFPSNDAMNNPIRIHLDASDEQEYNQELPSNSEEIQDFDIIGLNPDFIIISPKPDERIKKHDLFIVLSYFPMKNIDPSKVKVYLDDVDISSIADIDSTYLSVTDHSLMPGNHIIRVNLTNIIGQKYNDISWSFTLLPSQFQASRIINKQSSKLRVDYASGKVSAIKVNMGDIEYNHQVDFEWLNMKIKYFKSSLENDYEQPYNRYSFHFSNKLMNLKLGDSYPSIDKYVWFGQRIRGINFSIRRGPLSIDVINGKSKQAVQGDPKQNAMVISSIDSTTDNWVITTSRNNYIFQQDVSATKLGMTFNRTRWDINYVKVRDNISSIYNILYDAEIVIPHELRSKIQMDDDFIISDNVYSIRFDSLKNNFSNIFSNNFILYPSYHNWVGQKPKDNLIIGSNIEHDYDDARILIATGFSLSYFNQNRWNKFQHISELDTFSYDSSLDNKFLGYIDLYTFQELFNYESNNNFGSNSQPLIPSIGLGDLRRENFLEGLNKILNQTNINSYSTLQLRYLGHRIELGRNRNGPDYYSLLNPSLRTNYKETYFSDRFSMFKNKLLFYYKKSKETEGLYTEIKNPIETRKSIFNIGLYPGSELPTFNFGFHKVDRENGVETVKRVDTLWIDNEEIDTVITIDNRINISSRQFNISMTNQFKLWVHQIVSLNILLFEQNDQVEKNTSLDSLFVIVHIPEDAVSESYVVNLKSIYNNHWESSVYFNTSHYAYKKDGFDHKQVLNNYQFLAVYRPVKFFNKLICGMYYSTGRGSNYFTQYNFNLRITSKPIEDLYLNILFDYRIKYLGEETKSPNDILFRAQIVYDIL